MNHFFHIIKFLYNNNNVIRFFRIVFSKVLTFLNYIVSLNYYKFVIAFKNKIAFFYRVFLSIVFFLVEIRQVEIRCSQQLFLDSWFNRMIDRLITYANMTYLLFSSTVFVSETEYINSLTNKYSVYTYPMINI